MVTAVFFIFTLVCSIIIPNLRVGLDETMALPVDSFLKPYLNDVFNYLNVGPAAYFVFRYFFRFMGIQ